LSFAFRKALEVISARLGIEINDQFSPLLRPLLFVRKWFLLPKIALTVRTAAFLISLGLHAYMYDSAFG
jgi:hypothetical protein